MRTPQDKSLFGSGLWAETPSLQFSRLYEFRSFMLAPEPLSGTGRTQHQVRDWPCPPLGWGRPDACDIPVNWTCQAYHSA